MCNLPIRRDQFKTAAFLAYIAEQGGEVCKPTNPYEVVRYRAYWRGSAKAATHIVYAKESGLLTWMHGSKGHYRAFLDGAPMEELPTAPPKPKKKAAKKKRSNGEITREKLIERDGYGCWFCGKLMGDDCTIEHLVPKSQGGRNSLANYALAHRKCNNDAADMPLVQKLAMRERLHAERSGLPPWDEESANALPDRERAQ